MPICIAPPVCFGAAPYYLYDSVDLTFLAKGAVDRKAPILGILLGLAACSAASGVSIVADRQSGYFAPEEYAQDATRGDIPVVVRGAAFGLDQTALEKLVIKNMKGSEWGRHAHLAAATASSVDRRYFYVVMINPPPTITAASFCSQPNQPMPATDAVGSELRVTTDLCRFDKVAGSVSGRAAGVTKAGDHQVHDVISGSVLELTKPDQQRIDLDRDHGEGTQQRP